MSAQPGWYQDPEGPPGQARYWDGARWAARREWAPTGAPTDGRGGPGRPPWLLPTVAAVVVALLVGLGAWWVWRAPSADDEPTPDPTVVATSAGTTPEQVPTEPGELDCAAADSRNLPSGPELRAAGIVVPFPVHEEWGFRFDSSQWTWLGDLHAWGTVDIEPRGEQWAAGIVVGRLEAGHGFGEPQQAAEAMVECLVTRGPFNTGEEMAVTTSAAVTVDGMPGWSMEMTYPEEGEYGATVVRVLTLDAGSDGSIAGVIGFHPEGHSQTRSVISDLFDGITRQ